MAITMINVATGEERKLTSEPHIAAFIGSSNLNINGEKQDFKWRLSLEDVKRIAEVRKNKTELRALALEKSVPASDITDAQILAYLISLDNTEAEMAEQQAQEEASIEDEYEAKVRDIRSAKAVAPATTKPANSKR